MARTPTDTEITPSDPIGGNAQLDGIHQATCMPTVIGVRFQDGVVLAGDRRVVSDNRIVSDSFRHIVDIDSCATGAVGPPSALQSFQQRIEDEVRTYSHKREKQLTKRPFERLLATAAEETRVEGVGSIQTRDGVAKLLSVDADGGITQTDIAAVGTGAGIGIGLLEGLDTDTDATDGMSAVQDILATVAERDPGTGPDIDVVVIRDRA